MIDFAKHNPEDRAVMTPDTPDNLDRNDAPEFRYAGFLVRWIASMIDFVLVLLVSWGLELAILGSAFELLRLTGKVSGSFDDFLDPAILQSLTLAIYLAVSFTYYFLSHFHWGATLGKGLVGIRVLDFRSGGAISRTQSALRWVGYGVSFVLMGCGYLMVIFHPRKRGLHDLLAGTAVISRERFSSGQRYR